MIDVDLQIDSVNQIMEFNVRIDHTFESSASVDFFDGFDLGLLGSLEIAALAEGTLSIQVDLDFRAGVHLGDVNTGFTIANSTPLSQLNGGEGVQMLVGITADNPLPTNGALSNDVNFKLTFDRGGTPDQTGTILLRKDPDPVDANLPVDQRKPHTADNLKPSMLVSDLNKLFAQTPYGTNQHLSDIVEAGLFVTKDQNGAVTSSQLTLRAIDPTVRGMTISNVSYSSLLGFSSNKDSHWDDVVISLNNGMTFPVDLDRVDDVSELDQPHRNCVQYRQWSAG